MDTEAATSTVASASTALARLETYRIKGTMNEYEWGTNPYYTPEQCAEVRREAYRTYWWEPPVFCASGVGFVALALGSLLRFGADEVGSLNKAQEQAQGNYALIFAAVMLAPLIFLILRRQTLNFLHRHEVKEEVPDYVARMSADVHAAWKDWETALEATGKIEGGEDAHRALLDQDASLRPALHAYLTDSTISKAHKEQFERWFFQTCAEAYELHQTELEREDLYKTYTTSNALTAAMETPNAIAAAKEQSRVLSATVRDVLGDRLPDPLVSKGKDEPELVAENY